MGGISDDGSSAYTPRSSFEAVIEEEGEEDDALWGVQDEDSDEENDEEESGPAGFMQHRSSIASGEMPFLRVTQVALTDDAITTPQVAGIDHTDFGMYNDGIDGHLHESDRGYDLFDEQHLGASDDPFDDYQDQLPPSPLDPFPPLVGPPSSVPPGPHRPPQHNARDSIASTRSALRKRSSMTDSDYSSVPASPMVSKRVSFGDDVEKLEQERVEKLQRREEKRRRRDAEREGRATRKLPP